MTSKDQRYTQKKRKLSQKTTHKGEITDRQITLRVGEEELALLEMWMKQKDLTMTEVIEEILSTQENNVSSYAVRDCPETKHGKRIAGGKTVKRICVWIRSTLHDKAKDHAKAAGLSMNRYVLQAIREYRAKKRSQDRLALNGEDGSLVAV
jgi:predicted DNA binding CopG/RHH family protein